MPLTFQGVWDILPGMNAGASTSAVPSPIEGLGHSVGLVGRLGIEPGTPNAYPSPAFMPGLLGAFGERGADVSGATVAPAADGLRNGAGG